MYVMSVYIDLNGFHSLALSLFSPLNPKEKITTHLRILFFVLPSNFMGDSNFYSILACHKIVAV